MKGQGCRKCLLGVVLVVFVGAALLSVGDPRRPTPTQPTAIPRSIDARAVCNKPRTAPRAAAVDDTPCFQRECQRHGHAANKVYARCASRAASDPTCADPRFDAVVRQCVDRELPLLDRFVVAQLAKQIGGGKLAVYGTPDVVSLNVAHRGMWEVEYDDVLRGVAEYRRIDRKSKLIAAGVPHEAAHEIAAQDVIVIDVGANIGTHTVPLAIQGQRVMAFEAMPRNCQLIRTSMCLNGLHGMIDLFQMGLSNARQDCRIISHIHSGGNGIVWCSKDTTAPPDYAIAGDVKLRLLDTVMAGINHSSAILGTSNDGVFLDAGLLFRDYIMKIDVEGHEAHAFNGGVTFLTNPNTRPVMILMEVWQLAATMEAVELLMRWGYVGFTTLSNKWITNPEEFDAHFRGPKWDVTNYDGSPIDHEEAVFVIPSHPVASAQEMAAQTVYDRMPASLLQRVRRS